MAHPEHGIGGLTREMLSLQQKLQMKETMSRGMVALQEMPVNPKTYTREPRPKDKTGKVITWCGIDHDVMRKALSTFLDTGDTADMLDVAKKNYDPNTVITARDDEERAMVQGAGAFIHVLNELGLAVPSELRAREAEETSLLEVARRQYEK